MTIYVDGLDEVQLAELDAFAVLNNCRDRAEAATLMLERMLKQSVDQLPNGLEQEKKHVRH